MPLFYDNAKTTREKWLRGFFDKGVNLMVWQQVAGSALAGAVYVDIFLKSANRSNKEAMHAKRESRFFRMFSSSAITRTPSKKASTGFLRDAILESDFSTSPLELWRSTSLFAF